jgi:hypothetical protein
MSEDLKCPPAGPGELSSGSGLAPLPYALPSTQSPPHLGAAGGLTRGDAAAIALRLTGAYCLLRAGEMMVQLPSLVSMSGFRIFPHAREIGLYLAPCALNVGIGLWLILRTDRLAARLLRHRRPHPALPAPETVPLSAGSFAGMSGPDLQSIAFSVIGVVLVAQSFIPLTVAAWYYFFDQPSRYQYQWQAPGPKLIEGLAGFLVGTALFLGSGRLTAIWARVRGKTRRGE